MARHVICLHGGQRYAIPLSAVRRVTEISPLSRVPRAPPALLGVMNQQGRVACVVDLGPLVGLKARRRGHDPGRVIRDLAVMLADGGECVSDLGAVRDQEALFGLVASGLGKSKVRNNPGTFSRSRWL